MIERIQNSALPMNVLALRSVPSIHDLLCAAVVSGTCGALMSFAALCPERLSFSRKNKAL